MTSTYTHLHFRRANGLGAIVPMSRDGIGFREQPGGEAEFQVSDGCGPVLEKFADVLERMTRAGLCLQLGSTGPLFNEMSISVGEPEITIESELIQRRIISAQDDQLAEYRKLVADIDSALSMLKACGDPELEECAGAAGGISRVIWGLVLIARARKGELDSTKAHVRKIVAKMDEVEARLNTRNIHESAAVRMLSMTLDALEMVGTTSEQMASVEADKMAKQIKAFLLTLKSPVPNA